ncbi:hypothetical protein BBJ29_001322 [Phytophthora kernoviae]|uniref:beta-glucosidase n=1 Tax=Phytophthora kernoviae TaxID=325452 RepID=A0A421FWX7_9STRA|nr:hypothetical protein BBJ29_001322 [Phytophthora kernoviae]
MLVACVWTVLVWACYGLPESLTAATGIAHEHVYDPLTSVFAELRTPSVAPNDVDLGNLLANMTVRQKAAQMTQMDIYSMMDGDQRDPNKALKRDVVAEYARAGVGSILNTKIHQIYKEEGAAVPMLYGVDTIHGATYVQGATLFGQPISAAASFNPDLVYKMGAVAAKDTLSAGIPWIFSPVLGIAVQPKWARVYETFGEDPLLASVMGAALVRGLQSSGKVAACMKHFIGYSNVREGLDRADNVITDWELVNYYAPSFLAAVRAGVRTAMESYVSVNGVPVIASKKLLVDLLRHDMNFTGLLVSDYSEVDRMVWEHHLVPSVADAVRVTLQETSLDMNMSPNLKAFSDTIESLVAKGLIPESRLDESVRRILEVKRDLGLLDLNYYDEFSQDSIDSDSEVGSAIDQGDALSLAQESVILLENYKNTLPIDAQKAKSVFVTGPVSDNKGYLCGGWSVFWQGSTTSSVFPNGLTFKEAVQAKAESSGGQMDVEHLEVVDIDGNINPQDFQRGLELAAKSEYTLVALGEKNYAEKTGDLLGSLALSAGQLWYLEELAKLNSTKLLPYFHRVNTRCQPFDECPVQWEFGHGLSYSKFEYSSMQLNTTHVHAKTGALLVSVTVTNRGTRPGKEVVMLFVAQKYRRAAVPESKLLRAFKKLDELAPGASQDVEFVLTPDDWSYYLPGLVGRGFQKQAEPGEFAVSLLPSATDSSVMANPSLWGNDKKARDGQSKNRGGPNTDGSTVKHVNNSKASQREWTTAPPSPVSMPFFVVP